MEKNSEKEKPESVEAVLQNLFSRISMLMHKRAYLLHSQNQLSLFARANDKMSNRRNNVQAVPSL